MCTLINQTYQGFEQAKKKILPPTKNTVSILTLAMPGIQMLSLYQATKGAIAQQFVF